MPPCRASRRDRVLLVGIAAAAWAHPADAGRDAAEIVEESERKGATEAKRGMLLRFLVSRFGAAAKELEGELKAVEFDRLDDLAEFAAKCRNLASFRKRLLS